MAAHGSGRSRRPLELSTSLAVVCAVLVVICTSPRARGQAATYAFTLLHTFEEDIVGNGYFGRDVELGNDGRCALVGGRQADSGRGVAIVYRWDASQNLTEAPSFSQTLVSDDPQSGAEFGFSVAVAPSLDGLDSCGYLIVGEPRHGSFEGGVYIYAWDDVAGSYSLHQPKLKPITVGSGDQFGNSLSAADDVLVVGAQGGPGRNGTVYVYLRGPAGYVLDATIQAPDLFRLQDDGFGIAVATDGEYIAASQYSSSIDFGMSPQVFVFERPSYTLVHAVPKTRAYNTNEDYGRALSIDYPAMAVGVPYGLTALEHYNPGHVEICRLDEMVNLCSVVYVENQSTADGDDFGTSVAISFNPNTDQAVLLAGAHGFDSSRGAAFVFTGTLDGEFGLDRTEAEVTPPPTLSNYDDFGISLSYRSDMLIVGATRAGPGSDGGAYVLSWCLGASTPCDGIDDDLCMDGLTQCEAGTTVCTDDSFSHLDLCNNLNDDCNDATFDGQDDPLLFAPCDGLDSDGCDEGVFYSCNEGVLLCDDNTGDSLDTCDGTNDDCDPSTPDGSGEPAYGTPCGPALDMVWGCLGSGLVCLDCFHTAAPPCDNSGPQTPGPDSKGSTSNNAVTTTDGDGSAGGAVSPAAWVIPLALVLLVVAGLGIYFLLARQRRLERELKGYVDEGATKVYRGDSKAGIDAQVETFLGSRAARKAVVAKGGSGTVYAFAVSGSKIALKVLNSTTANDMEDLYREIHTLSLLMSDTHRNVIDLRFISHAHHAVGMEWCAEGDLSEWLVRHAGDYDPVDVALQVARGMNHLHSLHIAHLDLKTKNVLVATGGVLKISDFGLSRVIHSTMVVGNVAAYRGSLATSRESFASSSAAAAGGSLEISMNPVFGEGDSKLMPGEMATVTYPSTVLAGTSAAETEPPIVMNSFAMTAHYCCPSRFRLCTSDKAEVVRRHDAFMWDMYSAGVVFWSVFESGATPFEPLTSADLVARLELRDPVRLDVGAGWPAGAADAVAPCVDVDPDRRPPSFAAVVNDLEVLVVDDSS